MDHASTLRYLEDVQALGIKLGLETMSRLLAGMGNPQDRFASVVVAGTNGKGSVCAMLASILRAAGRRTGLYTSPHLVRYEERIAVDGRPVAPEELAADVSAVRDRIESLIASGVLASHPTHFEVLTAAAFRRFCLDGVEAAVLEVGMGGRLDAVAVARAPVAVITNVDLEHTEFLGSTLAEIAMQKAGVIADGAWVVTGESGPAPLSVIREEAELRGARLIERHREAVLDPSPAASSGRFGLEAGAFSRRDIVIPLGGRHQVENAVLAVLAALALRGRLPAFAGLTDDAIVEGLARTHWPGRLQVAGHRPLLLLDGAHNPAGCAALARALRDLRLAGAFARLGLVFGVLKDKDAEAMLAALLPLSPRIVATRGASERFREPLEVAAAARALGAGAVVVDDPAAAIEAARTWAGAEDAICICGSLYLVGDAMSALGITPFA